MKKTGEEEEEGEKEEEEEEDTGKRPDARSISGQGHVARLSWPGRYRLERAHSLAFPISLASGRFHPNVSLRSQG